MNIRILPAIITMALLSACAGPNYTVNPSSTMALPNDEMSLEQLGKRVVQPDEAFLTVPVGFRNAAKLKSDGVIEIIGKKFAFASDETLAMSSVSGRLAESLPANATTFCGRPNSNLAKNLLSASTLGITSLFNRTSSQTRVCFFDADNDSKAEKAILVGVKSEQDAAPVDIEPIEYEVLQFAPMSGESEMRLIYRGKTGLVGGHISFDIEVVEQDQKLIFDNVRRKVNIRDLPQQMTIMGTLFTVESYDPDSGKVDITVLRGFPKGTYGISTSYTTTSVPIYIPR